MIKIISAGYQITIDEDKNVKLENEPMSSLKDAMITAVKRRRSSQSIPIVLDPDSIFK